MTASGTKLRPRVKALIPDLEAYIQSGMKAFDAPGLAIGIVTGDRLIYAKGFGVRSKAAGAPVDSRTVFQIGSATKTFWRQPSPSRSIAASSPGTTASSISILNFSSRTPGGARVPVFDLLAQRSGLPPYANDMVGILGADEAAMIRSLRHVEPV